MTQQINQNNKRIVIILDKSAPVGMVLNGACHIAAQLGALEPDIKGSSIQDASGITHLGVPNCPNIILRSDRKGIKKVILKARALEKQPVIIDFPEEGFITSTDKEFCDAVNKKNNEDFSYIGVLLYGSETQLKKLTKSLSLYK